MKPHPFYIVDVFAEAKYTGNQLAVILDANDLSEDEMQQIARETNYSETTFVMSHQSINGGYDVRIFTPNKEVPFAGHPTLGTAVVIRDHVMHESPDTITLNLKVGPIPVTYDAVGDNYWMRQNQPVFGQKFDAKSIADILNLDINDVDQRFPTQEVSTGLPAIIVPLKSLDAVKRAKVDKDKYFPFVEKCAAKAIFIFCPETVNRENHLNSRCFVDYFGVPEDPATGSANGCLAAYLVNHRFFGESEIDIRVEQGYEIKRPSLLFLRAREQGCRFDVMVGGRVVPIAQGSWIPQ